uniref:Uncharacterized protein n=1 Tax=Corethron hystrix TaxID=216773 RepID=A0A7S1BR75_9STRA|mmetsp:Transcript_35731/g.83109  ORF Transcript_35731/g.83109 Transcript_35731/m.83109 type:complete len:222 (+) Transcript_35731:132-797(+)
MLVVSSVVAIAFAATMSLAAVGIEALIYVGAGTSMVIAPYAIYQRKQLRDMDSMRRVQNKIRKEVNRLQGENDKLHNNVTDLTTQVDRVEECEKELSSITDGMGKSVNEFVDLVKEHKKINTEIKKHLQIQVLQSLMDVVIKSDRDNDGVFSAQELKMVKVFIRNIRSVTFHEDRFDKIMDENPTLKNLMRIVRNLLDENVSEDERVFELHVDKFMEAGLP